MSEPTPWPELMRRARISLAFTKPRKREQAKRLAALLENPETEARRVAAVNAGRQHLAAEHTARLVASRQRPDHPFAPLPEMSRKERGRYRYLRTMTSRESALAVIMAERGATQQKEYAV